MDIHNIIKISVTNSTNTYLLSFRHQKCFVEGFVVVSDYQIKGRGQNNNKWESEFGKNLLISILVEPKILNENFFDLSIISALAIIDFLKSFNIHAEIKWPNDILVNDKKIAGILVQNIIFKKNITHSVIGIGLNVNQIIFCDYSPQATSLSLEKKIEFDLVEIQNELLKSFKKIMNKYRSKYNMYEEYINFLYKKNIISRFRIKDSILSGVIRGVTNSGLLLIEINGSVKKYNFESVKMIF